MSKHSAAASAKHHVPDIAGKAPAGAVPPAGKSDKAAGPDIGAKHAKKKDHKNKK